MFGTVDHQAQQAPLVLNDTFAFYLGLQKRFIFAGSELLVRGKQFRYGSSRARNEFDDRVRLLQHFGGRRNSRVDG
jgi:hypothetical protein